MCKLLQPRGIAYNSTYSHTAFLVYCFYQGNKLMIDCLVFPFVFHLYITLACQRTVNDMT